jgi:hypothetical protein
MRQLLDEHKVRGPLKVIRVLGMPIREELREGVLILTNKTRDPFMDWHWVIFRMAKEAFV